MGFAVVIYPGNVLITEVLLFNNTEVKYLLRNGSKLPQYKVS
jgi:hypothetical protein